MSGAGHQPTTERETRREMRHPAVHLVFWTLLGFAGSGAVIYGGITEDWTLFIVGMSAGMAALFMLGSGLFLRWPRGW